MAQPYYPITSLLREESRGKPAAIVGSGPSLLRTWPRMVGRFDESPMDIIACNAAFKFLCQRHVIPQYAMFWDADPVIADMVIPNDYTTFLIASRCHKSVFDKLNGCHVAVWHAAADQEPTKQMLEERGINEPLIHGGSAGVTRGSYLAVALGYHDLHLFGCDGSFEDEKTHVVPSVGKEIPMDVWCDGKWYKTTPWLAAQANEFKLIADCLRQAEVKMTVHGSGLIPHIAEAIGIPVIDDKEAA